MNDPSIHWFYLKNNLSWIMNKKIVSIIQKDNVTGVQFHPEKSQQNGVNFLEKYIDIFK